MASDSSSGNVVDPMLNAINLQVGTRWFSAIFAAVLPFGKLA